MEQSGAWRVKEEKLSKLRRRVMEVDLYCFDQAREQNEAGLP